MLPRKPYILLTQFSNSHLIHYFISTHPDLLQIEDSLSLAVNTSAHLPIFAKLAIVFYTPSQLPVPPDRGHYAPCGKVNWPKADAYLYKEHACKKLQNIITTHVETMHKDIVADLCQASEKAMPNHKANSKQKLKSPSQKK